MASVRQKKKNSRNIYNKLPDTINLDQGMYDALNIGKANSHSSIMEFAIGSSDFNYNHTAKIERLIRNGASNSEIKRQSNMPIHHYSSKEINNIRQNLKAGKESVETGKSFVSVAPEFHLGYSPIERSVGDTSNVVENTSKQIKKQFTEQDLYDYAAKANARKASRLAAQSSESMALVPIEKASVPAIKSVKSTGKEAAKAVGQEAAEGVAEGAAKKVGKSLLDKAVDMKIPQIALGVGVTAWLVNKLSDSRGQQSNAQLYGQQGY